MAETDKEPHSLIPIGNNQLKKVENAIAITDKILLGEIEQLFNKAFYLINSKDLSGIEENYCLKLASDKDYLKRNQFKYRAKEKDDYKKAIILFSKVLKTKPKHYFSFYFKGVSKGNLKDYEGAIKDYTKAIEIDPDDAAAYYNRGIAKCNLKDYEGAIEDYTKAIEIDPDYAFAYNNRGIAKKNLKDYKGAIKDYTKAIEIDPDYTTAYNNREIAKNNLNDLSELPF